MKNFLSINDKSLQNKSREYENLLQPKIKRESERTAQQFNSIGNSAME
jgi:hypothetical protein